MRSEWPNDAACCASGRSVYCVVDSNGVREEGERIERKKGKALCIRRLKFAGTDVNQPICPEGEIPRAKKNYVMQWYF